MSNPFLGQSSINSSQYISNKSNISKVKTLSCKRHNCQKNTINICNNKLTRAPSQSALMDFTKGFYLTKPHCLDMRNKAKDLTDGRYTYFDFNKIRIRNDGLSKCEYIPNYEFDICRVLNGKIVPLANINPTYKTKFFKMHAKMKIYCSECVIEKKNNESVPLIHDISCNLCHDHYFPTNTKDIKYKHNHESFNSNCCGKYPNCSHTPYPHINRYVTNQYFIARKHYPKEKNIKNRFSLKPKINKRKNVRNPYMGQGYDSKLRCNCKRI